MKEAMRSSCFQLCYCITLFYIMIRVYINIFTLLFSTLFPGIVSLFNIFQPWKWPLTTWLFLAVLTTDGTWSYATQTSSENCFSKWITTHLYSVPPISDQFNQRKLLQSVNGVHLGPVLHRIKRRKWKPLAHRHESWQCFICTVAFLLE